MGVELLQKAHEEKMRIERAHVSHLPESIINRIDYLLHELNMEIVKAGHHDVKVDITPGVWICPSHGPLYGVDYHNHEFKKIDLSKEVKHG